MIVESPAKAKTLEKFLGKDYTVKSCFGHVRDLLNKELSVDTKNNFMPTYEVAQDKKKVVAELKKLSKEAELVWLATDEDREGEAISWHLVETLNLSEDKVRRIVFHEITKRAILKAVDNPRGIDGKLVDAQQARRVLDRLVGYELSPVLWKKVKPALSAGRVQSVAVRLIVEREREINEFKSESYYKIIADFFIGDGDKRSVLKAELQEKFDTKDRVKEFLERCKKADFKIVGKEIKPAKKSPSPPFTTSTLQQEASRKLGFSVAQTMVVAQKLYESGKISYMRTDSVSLADSAIAAAKKEIIDSYGNKYANPRKYKTKTKGAQEAHEAIRPAYMKDHSIKGNSNEERLYELIWKRTIASQMSEAQIEKTVVTIEISTTDENFIARGEVLMFDGFLKVYRESLIENGEEAEKSILPPLRIDEVLNLDIITATERFTNHPPRYTEASLVRKLEIGRASCRERV